ncbi:MAG: DinB family protein, partial [Acidobacteriota bacterium]|nr:DinB family protein [Acidobacteriota bacterium]
MQAPQEEPWLRGPLPGVDPFIAPLLYSFQMAREDLARHTAGLTTEQIWATPHGFGSVGFHLRHIAGSTARLMTYVTGAQLSPAEISEAKAEKEPGATREMLLAAIDAAFEKAESTARDLDPATLT